MSASTKRGVRVTCAKCRHTKQPIGRSARLLDDAVAKELGLTCDREMTREARKARTHE